MKQYILLFLLFISNVCFAPNLPNISNETSNYYKENLAIVREEEKIDSIDVNYIKSLKIKEKHRFTKDERMKVRNIAKNLGIKKSKWLYKIIYIESRFNPRAINLMSGATGLIQWIPSSAIACGTTTKELYDMSVSEQLDYVEIYLKLALNGRKVSNFTDLYLAVFSPDAVGKSDSYIIGSKNSKVVTQNKNYMNSDSTITRKDIRLAIADALL
jgi:hypothetical protein